MSNLFIIGNGFDIAHGLKTSYQHFRKYLVQVEKEACAEVGETSVFEDCNLVEEDKIKYYFDSIVIPEMIDTLSDTVADLVQKNDCSSGTTTLEQLDNIKRFHDDADKIVQWIKHGSGQYYARERTESQAIKRFIAMLEPETGMISHNTNLNNCSIFWQVLESEFGESAVQFLQGGVGADKAPFWLTLRLFIIMIDKVERGVNWEDLETSMGTNNFEMIFDLFKGLESNGEIYEMCVEHFFVLLYYDINLLFTSWVLFTETTFEQQVGSKNIDVILSASQPKIKKTQNGIELSLTMKDVSPKKELGHTQHQITSDRNLMPKEQLLQIFTQAKTNYFFTFNYTQTLERIYGISESNICHIHGMSKDAKKSNDVDSEGLIFGHGCESFDTDVTNIVNTALNIAKKPVNQCIDNNQSFFEKLEGVTNIYSYGFSFGEVDMPYIEKICLSIGDTTNVTWLFNDYEIEKHQTVYEGKIRRAGFNGKFAIFHVD